MNVGLHEGENPPYHIGKIIVISYTLYHVLSVGATSSPFILLGPSSQPIIYIYIILIYMWVESGLGHFVEGRFSDCLLAADLCRCHHLVVVRK